MYTAVNGCTFSAATCRESERAGTVRRIGGCSVVSFHPDRHVWFGIPQAPASLVVIGIDTLLPALFSIPGYSRTNVACAWVCILVVFVLTILLTACVRSVHIPYEPHDQVDFTGSDEVQTALALFSYDKPAVQPEKTPLKIARRGLRARRSGAYVITPRSHDLQLLEFDSAGDNGQLGNKLRVHYYQSRKPGRKELVIVLSIFASSVYPAETIARVVRRRSGGDANVAVFLAEGHLLDFESLAEARNEAEFMGIARQMRQRVITSVVDIRRFIDWAEQQPDVDPERIGLVGFSMSSFMATLAVFVEPRLRAGVIVMGAAHPHDILSVCFGRPAMARDSVMQRFGWTVDDYRVRMQKVFRMVDPVIYQGLADPETLLMIDAGYDDCMPQNARNALWEALGRPERITYLYNHKKAFLAMTPLGLNTMRRVIYRFLEGQLKEKTVEGSEVARVSP